GQRTDSQGTTVSRSGAWRGAGSSGALLDSQKLIHAEVEAGVVTLIARLECSGNTVLRVEDIGISIYQFHIGIRRIQHGAHVGRGQGTIQRGLCKRIRLASRS